MIRKADREEFMRRLAAEHPNPKSELHFSTPFELLIAVVLSAQATDKGVNVATAKLFPVANTPEAILALGEEGLTPYVKTIGLYRNKVKHILGLCERLLSVYGGQVPEDREALMTLPGVGRKTANVVLNVAFGKTPDEVEEKLLKVIPSAYLQDAHHWLLLHGRYCCKARRPECERCPVAEFCSAPEKKRILEAK